MATHDQRFPEALVVLLAKVLVVVDSCRSGGKQIDRSAEVSAIRPPAEYIVSVPYAGPGLEATLTWQELLTENAPLDVEQVDFAHPLYVLYSVRRHRA
ncbi:hypothetical protein ACFWIY_25165 [Streptomyces sioyaensis]|uniref:hypothetical protein n=1 Tax=Streptomyces sioyaensis TaxID=67364 RepID=UPI0036504717